VSPTAITMKYSPIVSGSGTLICFVASSRTSTTICLSVPCACRCQRTNSPWPSCSSTARSSRQTGRPGPSDPSLCPPPRARVREAACVLAERLLPLAAALLRPSVVAHPRRPTQRRRGLRQLQVYVLRLAVILAGSKRRPRCSAYPVTSSSCAPGSDTCLLLTSLFAVTVACAAAKEPEHNVDEAATAASHAVSHASPMPSNRRISTSSAMSTSHSRQLYGIDRACFQG